MWIINIQRGRQLIDLVCRPDVVVSTANSGLALSCQHVFSWHDKTTTNCIKQSPQLSPLAQPLSLAPVFS